MDFGQPIKNISNFLLKLISNKIVPIIAPIGSNSQEVKFNINADLTNWI